MPQNNPFGNVRLFRHDVVLWFMMSSVVPFLSKIELVQGVHKCLSCNSRRCSLPRFYLYTPCVPHLLITCICFRQDSSFIISTKSIQQIFPVVLASLDAIWRRKLCAAWHQLHFNKGCSFVANEQIICSEKISVPNVNIMKWVRLCCRRQYDRPILYEYAVKLELNDPLHS